MYSFCLVLLWLHWSLMSPYSFLIGFLLSMKNGPGILTAISGDLWVGFSRGPCLDLWVGFSRKPCLNDWLFWSVHTGGLFEFSIILNVFPQCGGLWFPQLGLLAAILFIYLFISIYLFLCSAIKNGAVSLISFTVCFPSVCRKAAHFCVLIWCPATLLKSLSALRFFLSVM